MGTTWPTYRRWRKTSTKAPEWKKLINRKKPLAPHRLHGCLQKREKKTKTREEAPRKRRLRRTRHKDTDRTRDWKKTQNPYKSESMISSSTLSVFVVESTFIRRRRRGRRRLY